MTDKFLKDVKLSQYTTIGLGGPADLFISCKNTDDIVSALKYAKQNVIPVQVFSGGSNIIFPDSGYKGMVIKADQKGIEFSENENLIFVKTKAGEIWDDVVKFCIEKGLSGIESLSGIPGSAGAVPVQNVGAYGQEIKDMLVSLKAIDRETLKECIFNNEDCDFGYRQSRFKNKDKDRYIITEVLFGFTKDADPEIKYPELENYIKTNHSFSPEDPVNEKLIFIRKAVLELRKKKSMIIDINDPDSRSCGSFFMNPVINREELDNFCNLLNDVNKEQIPVFKTGDKFKIPAAWLIERAGFKKGYIKGGAGISKNHSLALININGTAAELLGLASEIKNKVYEISGISLSIEPVIV
ncbi:MAG TPA: UDP-N-acetylmuramate dehydrogenase [Ignavibacteria bacterium]|nr:UDP-N-acetylmuramate dehydrogenase [Ignavibacteria bacterium]